MKTRVFLLFLALTSFVESGIAQAVTNSSVGEAILTNSTNPSKYASEWRYTSDSIVIKNRTLHDIVAAVYPDPIPVVDETGLAEERFDLRIEGTNATLADFWNALQKCLREKYVIFTVVERRPIDFYELKTGAEKPVKLVESAPEQKHADQTGTNGWEFTAFSMDDLAAALSDHLNIPVYNETKLTGRYDFVIDWHGTLFPDQMPASLRKIGLNLEKVKKEKDVLVIKRTKFQLSK